MPKTESIELAVDVINQVLTRKNMLQIQSYAGVDEVLFTSFVFEYALRRFVIRKFDNQKDFKAKLQSNKDVFTQRLMTMPKAMQSYQITRLRLVKHLIMKNIDKEVG